MIMDKYIQFIDEKNKEEIADIDSALSQMNTINEKIAYLDGMLLFATDNNMILLLRLAIADLRLELAEAQEIDKSNMCWLDIHGFSNNYMFEPCDSSPTGWCKQDPYRKWIDKFPIDQLTQLDIDNVDFTKPIQVILDFVSLAKFDVENLVKSILDMIFERYLYIDDNIVTSIIANRVGTCQGFKDGKIGIIIRNL